MIFINAPPEVYADNVVVAVDVSAARSLEVAELAGSSVDWFESVVLSVVVVSVVTAVGVASVDPAVVVVSAVAGFVVVVD